MTYTLKPRILFFQYSANPSGSTISGLLAVKGFLEKGWHVDTVFGFDGSYVQEYHDVGCQVHVVEHKNWLRGRGLRSVGNIWDEVQTARKVADLIQRLQPSVVYVNTLVSLAGIIAAKRTRTPSVWHVRELFDDVGGEMHPPLIGGKLLVRWILRHLPSQPVVVSRAVADNVLGEADEAKVLVIPNAVSRAYFEGTMPLQESRDQLGLHAAKTVVGVPGGLRPVKGHAFFLEAAAKVASHDSECRFVISGSGPSNYRDWLESKVKVLGLADRVVFTGRLDNMQTFYSACDLVCIPSQSESFGRTAIEAMAMGIPVIGTRVGGLQDILDDGKNGFLVDYGDVAALAGAMAQLLEDPVLRQRFGVEGRRKAELEYSESVYQRRVVGVVDRLLAKARPN